MYPGVGAWARGCVYICPYYTGAFAGSPGSWVLIPQDMAASPTHRPQLSKVKQGPPPYLLSGTPTYLSKHPRVHSPRSPLRHRAHSPLPQVHISPNSSTSPLSCAHAPDLHTSLLTCAHAPKSAHLFPNLPQTRMPQSTYTFSSQAHPPISHTASFPEYLPPPICIYGPFSCALNAPHIPVCAHGPTGGLCPGQCTQNLTCLRSPASGPALSSRAPRVCLKLCPQGDVVSRKAN